MDIKWFPIKGFEGLYEWSPTTEEVRSLPRNTTNGKVLKWGYDKQGRPYVILSKNGVKRKFCNAMLIYSHAHQVEILEGYQVHHIDGNKYNNNPSNLQLLTKEEHIKIHSKAVVAVDEKGNVVYRFASVKEAGRNGFNQGAVSCAARGCFHREGNHYYKWLRWFFESEWLAMQK